MFVGRKVIFVCAGYVRGRHVTAWLSFRSVGGFVGEDGFHSGGDVVQCETGWINLRTWVCAELLDHVVGEGVEEDSCLFACDDGRFPELFQGGKESEGELEFGKVYSWSHGDVITEIAVEVGS